MFYCRIFYIYWLKECLSGWYCFCSYLALLLMVCGFMVYCYGLVYEILVHVEDLEVVHHAVTCCALWQDC